MLWIVLCVIVFLVLPVILRFAEGDDGPDNAIVHHQEDDDGGQDEPGKLAIAA